MTVIINILNLHNFYSNFTGYSAFIREGGIIQYYEKENLKVSFSSNELIGSEVQIIDGDPVEHQLPTLFRNAKPLKIMTHRHRVEKIGILIAEKLNVKFSKRWVGLG